MKKITTTLILLIALTGVVNAEYVYEKELPVTQFTEIDFDSIQEEAEEIGWRDYYMELINEKAGIYDDTVYSSWRVTPYISKIRWVYNIATKEVKMVDYDLQKEKEKFEINKDQFGFNISLISASKNEIKSKNLTLIYEDDKNGRIEIKNDNIVNEEIETHNIFEKINTISLIIPIENINMKEFSLYIINRDYERLDLNWSFKPAE